MGLTMIEPLKQKYYVLDEDGCSDREVVEKVNELIGILNEQQKIIRQLKQELSKEEERL